jgi:hypothetical protein
MRKSILSTVAVAAMLASAPSIQAASSEQEKAFVESYRKAFEAKDTKTLESFLYTAGADPTVLEFYKSMQASDAGKKISSIELVSLTPEQVQDAAKVKDGPGGKLALPLKPSKKLVIKVTTSDANGSSTSTSQVFIAEADGKLVIPVPAPVR